MSADECLRVYRTLVESAFKDLFFHIPARPTETFSATALEKTIKTVIVEQCIKGVCNVGQRPAAEMLFRDETCCKT